MIESGKIQSIVDRVYPMAEAAAAHRRVETEQRLGGDRHHHRRAGRAARTVIVFEAARRLLAAQPVPRVTLEAVAARAGVDSERLRHRWPGATWLLAETLGRAGAIEDIPDRGDTRSELAIALERLLDVYAEDAIAERTAPLIEERLSSRNSRAFTSIARLGPTREPGALVDIVVRLVGNDGIVRLVKVPQQRIRRLE